MDGTGCGGLGAFGQVLVGDHHIVTVLEVGDGGVGDLDVGETGVLDLVAQHRRAHGAGAHAGVAGEDDVLHWSGEDARAGPRTGEDGGDRALLALHGFHPRGGGIDVGLVVAVL